MKFFNLQKNKYKKEGSTMPDYKISAKVGDDAFVEIGAGWIKKDKAGNTFLSCKLSDAYVDHTKNTARKGFSLVEDGQTETAKNYEQTQKEDFDINNPDSIPF